MLERVDVPGTPDTPLFALNGLANAGYTPDRITDGIVANVSAQQSSTGHWVVPHGAIARPPIEDGDIARTALGIGALKNYGAPGRAAEFNERIARARGWLAAAKATTSDDRNMQLIGLRWAGAEEDVLRRLARTILAAQRSSDEARRIARAIRPGSMSTRTAMTRKYWPKVYTPSAGSSANRARVPPRFETPCAGNGASGQARFPSCSRQADRAGIKTGWYEAVARSRLPPLVHSRNSMRVSVLSVSLPSRSCCTSSAHSPCPSSTSTTSEQ